MYLEIVFRKELVCTNSRILASTQKSIRLAEVLSLELSYETRNKSTTTAL